MRGWRVGSSRCATLQQQPNYLCSLPLVTTTYGCTAFRAVTFQRRRPFDESVPILLLYPYKFEYSVYHTAVAYCSPYYTTEYYASVKLEHERSKHNTTPLHQDDLCIAITSISLLLSPSLSLPARLPLRRSLAPSLSVSPSRTNACVISDKFENKNRRVRCAGVA